MTAINYNPNTDSPISIIMSADGLLEEDVQYISIKVTSEGVIVDFFADGEVSKTLAGTYTEIWEQAL